MRKLTAEERVMIDAVRKTQLEYLAEDEERFNQLLSKLSIEEENEPQFASFLFDYIYNSADNSSGYLDYLIEKLYGSEE